MLIAFLCFFLLLLCKINTDVDHRFVRMTLLRVLHLLSVKCPSGGTLNGAAYKKKPLARKRPFHWV